MKIYRGWNAKTPAVILTFDTVDLADKFQNENLISITGHKVGNRPKAHPNRISLSGLGALKVLALLSENASMFKDWKPQHESRHYNVSDDEILKDAAQFTTRSAWSKGGQYYQLCLKHRRELFEKAVAHMAPPIDPLTQTQVYVYEFSDHSCYVGLTCNPKRRHKDHLERGLVFKKISTGIKYELKILREDLSPKAAAELEVKEIASRKSAWTVYNRHKGGSLGQLRFKYSYEEILAVAKTCASKKDFFTRFSAMSQIVSRRKWSTRLDSDMDWPKRADHVWTPETCLAEARKFKWKVDWITGSPSSYAAARKHGWLKEITKIVGFTQKPPKIKWTVEACSEDAKRFSSRSEWQVKSGSAYRKARLSGWLDEISDSSFGQKRSRWIAST